MQILFFIIACILLSAISGIIFVFVFILGLLISGKISILQHKSNDEWNETLMQNEGRHVFFMIICAYVLSITLIIPVASLLTKLFGFEHNTLTALIMWGIVMILMTLKISKIKKMFKTRFNENQKENLDAKEVNRT